MFQSVIGIVLPKVTCFKLLNIFRFNFLPPLKMFCLPGLYTYFTLYPFSEILELLFLRYLFSLNFKILYDKLVLEKLTFFLKLTRSGFMMEHLEGIRNTYYIIYTLYTGCPKTPFMDF